MGVTKKEKYQIATYVLMLANALLTALAAVVTVVRIVDDSDFAWVVSLVLGVMSLVGLAYSWDALPAPKTIKFAEFVLVCSLTGVAVVGWVGVFFFA